MQLAQGWSESITVEKLVIGGHSLAYAEMANIEAGLKFKTRAGLTVETTGVTQAVENHDMHVHEVVIVDGAGEGSKYLHNLDYAEKV